MTKALESEIRESPAPLNQQLEEIANRIELGDSPQTVFRTLTDRVPLETFLLFASALSVHWEVGGSLAPTLATVGRTIRDRIEMSKEKPGHDDASSRLHHFRARRHLFHRTVHVVQRSGTHAGVSDDERRKFSVATAVMLQALGIAWSAFLSRGRI